MYMYVYIHLTAGIMVILVYRHKCCVHDTSLATPTKRPSNTPTTRNSTPLDCTLTRDSTVGLHLHPGGASAWVDSITHVLHGEALALDCRLSAMLRQDYTRATGMP